jgi:glycosyltransferase involved in cell wall biosynthesis
MTDRPLVSVVVPFFDSERYIAACIESLLGQKDVGGPYEILLVDNRSPDGSASIAARYPELTLLEEATPGAYAARNAGVRRARAPLIAFTDADCVVDDDWLRSILEVMRDPGIAISLGHCSYPGTASFALRLLGSYENAKTAYVLERCAPRHHFGYANNMAVRASVFRDIGPFREWKRAGDTELVQRLAAQRPELRTVYRPSMRVTHLEFELARRRVGRLALYTRTNSRIDSFRELGLAQRLGLLAYWLRGSQA